MFIFEGERERERDSRGRGTNMEETEREREEGREFQAGSTLSAQSLTSQTFRS